MNNHKHLSLISISGMTVYMTGPLTLSGNHAQSIIQFQSCNVSFSKSITFKSNNCHQIVMTVQTYIKVVEYTNITFIKNKYCTKLIRTNNENEFYPLCIFQFVTLRNMPASSKYYSINIRDNHYYCT